MRRDEEKQKIQAKVLVAAVREVQKQEGLQSPVRSVQSHETQRRQPVPQRKTSENPREPLKCYYCRKKEHLKRNCRKRMKNEKIFQED